MLQWMDADLIDYVEYFDSISEKIALANRI